MPDPHPFDHFAQTGPFASKRFPDLLGHQSSFASINDPFGRPSQALIDETPASKAQYTPGTTERVKALSDQIARVLSRPKGQITRAELEEAFDNVAAFKNSKPPLDAQEHLHRQSLVLALMERAPEVGIKPQELMARRDVQTAAVGSMAASGGGVAGGAGAVRGGIRAGRTGPVPPRTSSQSVPVKLKPKSPIDYDHVIGADFNKKTGKPTGGHSLVNGDVRLKPGTESAPDSSGTYKASVQMRDPNNPSQWIDKTSNGGINTMLPKNWTADRIKSELDSSWSGRQIHPTNSNMWQGTTSSGVKIEGYTTPKVTAYPIYQGP